MTTTDNEPPAAPADKPRGERIAKVMARAGVASRRDAEAMVEAGRVTVNGVRLDTPACLVTPRDEIRLDGEPLPRRLRTRAFLFHKPRGFVTTTKDPEGRPTVFDILPAGMPRVVSVGRLDINTEGLLILTNDGGLARVLELPATGWTRKYRVRVHGAVDEDALKGLAEGTAVDGVLYGPIHVTVDRVKGENAWLTVSLAEGKNREVKVVLGALGLEVSRLIRISFGPFQLGDLPRGELREVPTRQLKDQLGPRLAAEAGADFEAPVTAPPRRGPTGEGAAGRPARGTARGARERQAAGADSAPRPGKRAGARGKPAPRTRTADDAGRDPAPAARPARADGGGARARRSDAAGEGHARTGAGNGGTAGRPAPRGGRKGRGKAPAGQSAETRGEGSAPGNARRTGGAPNDPAGGSGKPGRWAADRSGRKQDRPAKAAPGGERPAPGPKAADGKQRQAPAPGSGKARHGGTARDGRPRTGRPAKAGDRGGGGNRTGRGPRNRDGDGTPRKR